MSAPEDYFGYREAYEGGWAAGLRWGMWIGCGVSFAVILVWQLIP